MSRFRVTLVMAGLVVALATLALTSHAQQPPGGPGGRGQRGGRGGPGGPGGPGFGGPGFGGPGGPGGNLVMLASNEVVQKELKMTDRQKALVKRVSDEQNTKRREVFQNLRQQTAAAKAQAVQEAQAQAAAAQIDPSLDARGAAAGNPLVSALNQRGGRPQIFGGQTLDDPAAAQQAQQALAQAQVNAVQAQGWQMTRQAMEELQHESERDLTRALDKNQFQRLKQIQLQVEGPFAVLRPEIAERLELSEEQVAQIQEIQNESNQARREAFTANREIFAGFRKNQGGGGNPAAADTNGDQAQNANPQAGNGNPQTANGRGRNGRSGNAAGGRGGPGGRGRFDPEAMRKYMEQPEVKTKMDQMRKQQDLIRDQSYAQVYKVLDRRQTSAFKKMLGKPFDVDSLMAGFFRGPGQRNGQGAGPSQKNETAKDDTAKAGESSKSSSTPTSKSATAPRRQSLRERRGLGQQQAPSNSPN
jgi:hypothetical protein